MKNKFGKAMYVFAKIACIVMFLISLILIFYIVQSKRSDYYENKRMERLRLLKENTNKEIYVLENVQEIANEHESECEEEKQILPEYEAIYEENNDLYGWIEIEDSEINYPVMYTPSNPNFYVYRNFDKVQSTKGCIYIEGTCQPDSENLLIYGHNMVDLSMFGYLSYYKEKSFYEDHKYIKFDTIYEKSIYEIIAVSQAFIREEDLMEPTEEKKNLKTPFKEVSDDEYLFYNHLNINTEKDFKEYVNYMKKHSYYEIDTDVDYGNKLITLCTCTNTKKYQNERLLIIAKKIEQQQKRAYLIKGSFLLLSL